MEGLTGFQGLVFSLAYAWFLAQAKVALIVEQARREVGDAGNTQDVLEVVLRRGAVGGARGLPPPPASHP